MKRGDFVIEKLNNNRSCANGGILFRTALNTFLFLVIIFFFIKIRINICFFFHYFLDFIFKIKFDICVILLLY